VAVTTHARVRPEADYNTLPTAIQNAFDVLMEQAEDARTTAEYERPMRAITALTGVRGEIRKCACSCYCGRIFDANQPDAHVIEYSKSHNLGRHQCPTCADRHRETA